MNEHDATQNEQTNNILSFTIVFFFFLFLCEGFLSHLPSMLVVTNVNPLNSSAPVSAFSGTWESAASSSKNAWSTFSVEVGEDTVGINSGVYPFENNIKKTTTKKKRQKIWVSSEPEKTRENQSIGIRVTVESERFFLFVTLASSFWKSKSLNQGCCLTSSPSPLELRKMI